MTRSFLALDWGTSNLRAWVVEDGKPVRHQTFNLGVSRLQPGEAARRFHDTVRPEMQAQDLPALMCGMIGSTLGWEVAPYLDCPAGLDDLRGALLRVESEGAPAWIVPGLRGQRPDGGPDVMRGEETHLFGWAAARPQDAMGKRLVVHPGTHAKWVRMTDGAVDSFVTSMTGELFERLCRESVLQVEDAPEDSAAFELGLEAAGDGGALASRLFTARSRVVGGDMPKSQVKSYLSGLLIGAEVASLPGLFGIDRGAPVTLIGDLKLCAYYTTALTRAGFEVSVFDGEDAVLAGLTALAGDAQ